MSLIGTRWSCLDFETTGFSPKDSAPCSVAVGHFDLREDAVEVEIVMSTLIHPGHAIPPKTTAIHGITDDMVKDAEPWAAVALQILPLLDGRSLLAYNLPFDLAFLRFATGWIPETFTCGQVLAQAAYGKNVGCKLHETCARFGIDPGESHNAAADVIAAARCLPHLLRVNFGERVAWNSSAALTTWTASRHAGLRFS